MENKEEKIKIGFTEDELWDHMEELNNANNSIKKLIKEAEKNKNEIELERYEDESIALEEIREKLTRHLYVYRDNN